MTHPEPPPRETAGEPTRGTRLSVAEIHRNVREAAGEEMRRPVGELAFSSLAAGLAIGFSFVAAAHLTLWVPERHAPLAAALGYPLGFILVVQARNQLFTENTLEPVIPFLHRHDRRTLQALIRIWLIVLAGNLVGAIMAWLVASTHSTVAQVLDIWITTAPIAAFGFDHSIAGATEAFNRAAIGNATWSAMLGGFLAPALIGNVIGGVVLVALQAHGQVGGDREAISLADAPRPS